MEPCQPLHRERAHARVPVRDVWAGMKGIERAGAHQGQSGAGSDQRGRGERHSLLGHLLHDSPGLWLR